MESNPPEQPILAPFGTWPSSLSSRWMSSGTSLVDPQWSGNTLVWLEQRPDRSAIVAWNPNRGMVDLTFEQPIRGGLFYGGGEFGCSKDWLVFVAKSGQIYRQSIHGGIPVPITAMDGKSAAPAISPDETQMLFVHTHEEQDSLRMLDLLDPTAKPTILASSADFYMQPVWHPGGQQIAWVEWDHPQMPWQGSRLMLADLDKKPAGLLNLRIIAGENHSPVFQPVFSPDGRWLSYIESVDEFDQLVLFNLASGEKSVLCKDKTLMLPAWVQGLRTYGWLPDSSGLIISALEKAISHVFRVQMDSHSIEEISIEPFTYLAHPSVCPMDGSIAALVSSPSHPTRLVVINQNGVQTIKTGMPETTNSGELPVARPVEWESSRGIVFGLYYPPSNTRYKSDGLPPVIIHVHSGPTLQANANFSADTAFFTSKGYAYLSVNYRGSTGFGRSYRDALNGNWGVVDVEDAISAVKFIQENQLGDPDRMVIKGSSAGGYTVLNCLIRHPGLFKAGICSYGVSNLFTVVEETFKFESHYYDSLIGTLPDQEAKFREWSPIFHADQIRDPIILFHGSEDPVVPIAQTEEIVTELCQNGTAHEYHRFDGEGHGWRKTETLGEYYGLLEAFLNKFLFPDHR